MNPSVKQTLSPNKNQKKLRNEEQSAMKNEMNIASVHQSGNNKGKREISSERESLRTEASEDSSGSTRTYVKDDPPQGRNDNVYNIPSRDVSVDGDSQINSKIIGLIESEMKREAKHSTFSDSRPQSLSFYEEEKMPEELSGNLELLSPEERKHYKRRKDKDFMTTSQMETDERNMYNNIQDIYNRHQHQADNEDIMTASMKKSKSRSKKKHGADSEMGMGDSREMMIPKEKRKSKKKKHESSPMSDKKRKHRKIREEEFEGTRNDITLALEDLQDDVFEQTNGEEYPRIEKVKRSPRKSDKLYIQKKNKFELATRDLANMESHPIRQQLNKPASSPLYSAINAQKYWRKFTNFCHGLLGGLGFAHMTYIFSNQFVIDAESLKNYALYSDIYVILFYILCILCLVSVFDKYDIANLEGEGSLNEFAKNRKGSCVIVLYIITFVLHLVTAPKDDQIALMAQDFNNSKNITSNDMKLWTSLSVSRGFFAFLAWFFISLASPEDFLYSHLKSLDTMVIPQG